MLKFAKKAPFETEALSFNQGHVFQVTYSPCAGNTKTWRYQDLTQQRELTLEFEEESGRLCQATFKAKTAAIDGTHSVFGLRINPKTDAPTRPEFEFRFPQFASYLDYTSFGLTFGNGSLLLSVGPLVLQAGAAEGHKASFIWAPYESLNLIYLHNLGPKELYLLKVALGVIADEAPPEGVERATPNTWS